MPILTLKAVRENPWNVISHTLPERPERLLLELAYLTADYCRRSEYFLVDAARARIYVPEGWQPDMDYPDVHEWSEALGWNAEGKEDEICEL